MLLQVVFGRLFSSSRCPQIKTQFLVQLVGYGHVQFEPSICLFDYRNHGKPHAVCEEEPEGGRRKERLINKN